MKQLWNRRHRAALVQKHPDEPWLWKKDWAEGRIRASKKGLVAPLLFAVATMAFCVPLCHAWSYGQVKPSERHVLWWATAGFSSLGLIMIVWAAVALARWRKYGRCVFEMASVPGVIGGQLAGVVRTPVKIQPDDVFRVKLSCISCTTSKADDSISRTALWQDEQVVARDLLQYDADRTAIPILF